MLRLFATIVFAVACPLLAACDPSPAQETKDIAQCVDLGFKPDTDWMASCRLTMHSQRDANNLQGLASIAALVPSFILLQR